MAEPYTIVGAGLTGATVARVLAEGGKTAEVFEKEGLVGGLAADVDNMYGNRVNLHGPHVFHTNDSRAYAWMERFSKMLPSRWRVYARTHEWGDLPLPLTLPAIQAVAGKACAARMVERFGSGRRVRWSQVNDDPDLAPILSTVFHHYSKRMWGEIPPANITDRVAVLCTTPEYDCCYFGDSYVAVPADGYTALIQNMLDHPNIRLFVSARWSAGVLRVGPGLVHTGPMDEGREKPLPWRGMLQYPWPWAGDTVDWPEGASVLNTPQAPCLRVTRYGSAYRAETPDDYPRAPKQYPMPGAVSDRDCPCYMAGRLGTYRYLNMDRVVREALDLGHRLLEGG